MVLMNPIGPDNLYQTAAYRGAAGDAEMANQVNVKIFGQEFTIKGEDTPQYVQALAEFVDKKMREVASASSVITSHKVAMLTAINIADELFRLRQEKEEQEKKFGETVDQWIEAIGKTIEKQ